MEGNGHQRRQYEHQQYSRGFPPNYRPNVSENNAPERFGQAQMMMGRRPSPTSAGSTTGAHPQELGSFGYPASAQYPSAQMQSSSLQFPPDYSQDQQRSQNFPQYTSQMMYNVPQQPQPRSPYDPVPQYQPRQSAALEALSNQFGVSPYFQSGEPMGASGHTSPDQQYASSQFHHSVTYQSPGSSRHMIATAYPAGMTEYPQSAGQEVVEQPEREGPAHHERFNQYHGALRQVFEATSKGRVTEAADSLIHISEQLLPHVKELGLVSDNWSERNQRLKLWKEFNLGWLTVLQRQKDVSRQMLISGQSLASQNILQEASLTSMGNTLLRFCDGLDKYGLVDYQMGVQEEEILSIIDQCLCVLEGDEGQAPEGGSTGPRNQEGSSA